MQLHMQKILDRIALEAAGALGVAAIDQGHSTPRSSSVPKPPDIALDRPECAAPPVPYG